MTKEFLPDELLWAEGGHVSDIVLTALADGQDIVPAVARAHVDRCTACTTHLGHAALLAVHVHVQMKAYEAVERPSRRPLPRLAIALGLGVAFVGFVPAVFDSHAQGLVREVPLFVRAVIAIARSVQQSDSTITLILTYAVAITLVAMGMGFARLISRPEKETPR